jgi:hypothetical protein
MGATFLLISDHPEDPAFLAEIAAFNEGSVRTVPDVKAAAEVMASTECAGVFIDVDAPDRLREFETALQAKFGLISGGRLSANVFHFMSDRPLAENRELTNSPLFANFMQRPTQEHEDAARFYARYLKAESAHNSNDLEEFLGERGGVQHLKIQHSDQKQEVAEAVRQYLMQGKIPPRIANIIANSVDEVLMNAIFDAPTDDFGRPVYTATERNQSRQLTERETSLMKIGFDGFFVGVTVVDQWGSLDRARLLHHVSINYKDSDYTVKQGQAGAGLGLATIFQGGATLIYDCTARKQTKVTLIYRAYDNYRSFKNQFHFFQAKFHE